MLCFECRKRLFEGMANKNPVITEEFKAHIIQRHDDTTEPLADRKIQVRLTRSVDKAIRSLPSMTAWLRRVITEAAQRELMASAPAEMDAKLGEIEQMDEMLNAIATEGTCAELTRLSYSGDLAKYRQMVNELRDGAQARLTGQRLQQVLGTLNALSS